MVPSAVLYIRQSLACSRPLSELSGDRKYQFLEKFCARTKWMIPKLFCIDYFASAEICFHKQQVVGNGALF